MSDADHATVVEAPPIAGWLSHPLVGLELRRTTATLAMGVGYLLLFGGTVAGPTVSVGGVRLDATTRGFDELTALVIFVATVAITVGPLLYAAWNGGPLLAFAISTGPVLVGEIVAGRYALGPDGAIALTTGAAGATFAVYTMQVRTDGSLRPWRGGPVDEDGLLVVTVLGAIAAVSVARFVLTAPDRVASLYLPVAVLWLVPFTIVPVYWATWLFAGRRPVDGPRST